MTPSQNGIDKCQAAHFHCERDADQRERHRGDDDERIAQALVLDGHHHQHQEHREHTEALRKRLSRVQGIGRAAVVQREATRQVKRRQRRPRRRRWQGPSATPCGRFGVHLDDTLLAVTQDGRRRAARADTSHVLEANDAVPHRSTPAVRQVEHDAGQIVRRRKIVAREAQAHVDALVTIEQVRDHLAAQCATCSGRHLCRR